MSKEDRFALLNTLSFNDKFFDNENEEYLDSLDVVRILNHYDKTLSEFVKREVEKQDKITDLEAKLEDKEKEIEDLKAQRHIYLNRSVEECNKITDLEFELQHKDEEITQLKQELAEKDEEIEDVKAVLFAQKLDKEYTQILAIQNCEQEKISFCIEQLEKVKEIISFKPPMQTYEEIIKTFMFRIDNQIKQLKEGK